MLAGFFPSHPGTSLVWGGAEALLWWEKDQPLPPNLVTTGLPTDARPGALHQPNTLVVSGPSSVGFGAFPGVRVFAGVWLDPHGVIGMDAGSFVLEDRGHGFAMNSTAGGNPVLALRHLDPLGNAEDAFVLAAPAISGGTVPASAGRVVVQTDSQLWGADGNLLHVFCWSPCFRLVGLAGLRYLGLEESATIGTRKAALGSSPVTFLGQSYAAPAVERTSDQFHGRDQFFGGQVGLRGEYFFHCFFVALSGKLALGETTETANILGISTLQLGNARPQTVGGGLFALPSNSGHFVNQDFGFVPEVQVKGGVLLTPWLRATVGYNFLYWSQVLRAGSAIDLTVDRRQVPTDPAFQAGALAVFPHPTLTHSDFWVQGVTLGRECNF